MKRFVQRGKAWLRTLEGRRVTVVGLARSGLAACQVLLEAKARMTATDAKPLEALSTEARMLVHRGVRLLAGGHPPEAFDQAELIVLSPGVPTGLPALEVPRQAGVPIIGELELAWRASQAQFCAITGTNGKTTTTALTGVLLQEQPRPVLVGGNIGRALAREAWSLGPEVVCVAEVSSFQLETTDEFRPHVAAVLNLAPDHLDRYPEYRAYVAAKARILIRQGEEDYTVLNADDPDTAKLARQTRGHVIWFSRRQVLDEGVFERDGKIIARLGGREQAVCSVEEIFLRGVHNRENVLAATACTLLFGVEASRLRGAIRAFRGVPHRIEWVRELAGVTFYNDSKGTNVASTLRALESFHEPVILIAGGKGKGDDYAVLRGPARARVRAAVLIGEAREKIARALVGVTALHEAGSMVDAVTLAWRLARPGDVVLLSPACASFDMFRDYEERGEVFKRCVHELSAHAEEARPR